MMNRTQPDVTFDYRGANGLTIVAYRWDTTASPRAVVQITHGMGEHALRYGEFARALNAAGIVVYAQDQRNHGATAKSKADLGQLGPNGWSMLLEDIHLLVQLIRSQNPNMPLVLLGHSMGSFAVQQYLLDHSMEVDAVILSGTIALDLSKPAVDQDQPVDLSLLNAPFRPARTDFDWLTRDEKIVDAYVNDPLCGFGIDADSSKEMFAGAQRLANPEAMNSIRKDLPVYIVVGDRDPLNRQLALVTELIQRFETAGLTDVTFKAYPEARHEVLNETNRNDVVKDILTWLERVLARF